MRRPAGHRARDHERATPMTSYAPMTVHPALGLLGAVCFIFRG
jgi:hypothetical protein